MLNRYRHQKTRYAAAGLLLIAMVLIFPWRSAIVLAAEISASTVQAVTSKTCLLDASATNNFDINAKAFLLYDAQSGQFLFGKNPDAQLSPASITKVMTVLLVLERLQLTDTITVTRDMFASIPNDYVRLGLIEGEVISVEEALYATLLISANDTAMSFALTMGGSVSGFADMMNERAMELGCTGTHFTNPYGLAEASNITTAHDMALILAEALKNETYTKISTTKNHLIPPTNKYGSRGLTNGNRFVSTQTYAYQPYIGGKTGFTDMSGHTIVAGARKNGRLLIGVILGATSSEIRYANLKTLFECGFSAYNNVSLDPLAFESAKSLAINRIESQLQAAGLGFTVADTSLKLNAYTTTTAARSSGGFTCSIGDGPVTMPVGESNPVITYPINVEFKDGVINQVGTFSLTLKQMPKAAAYTSQAGQTERAGLSTGVMILRISIFMLAAICLLCLVVYILFLRELKRRKRLRKQQRYTRPTIRRL